MAFRDKVESVLKRRDETTAPPAVTGTLGESTSTSLVATATTATPTPSNVKVASMSGGM